MIFFCLGLPGRFAEWCDDVVARLARTIGGSVIVESWPSYGEMLGFKPLPSVLDEAARKLIIEAPSHLVMGARQPDERLRAALAGSQARFVVALDDPRFASADLLAHTGADPSVVARVVANSCPLMTQFTTAPGALTLHADRARADIAGTVCEIARHFAVAMPELGLERAIDEVASDPTAAMICRDDAVPPISEPARRIIDGALSGYSESFARGGAPGQLVWQRELFILYDDGAQRATGIVDIAGRPRCLIYGPYIHLAPGRWTVRVVLGFSPDAAGNTFLVDAYADRQLGHTIVVPGRGGVYAADIDFLIDQQSPQGLEIRVFVTNENARGQLALGHAILQPLAMRQLDAIGASEEFESVLAL